MAAEERSVLQFVPFASRLEAGFWHELSRMKLEHYQLSEAAVALTGHYTNSETVMTSWNS